MKKQNVAYLRVSTEAQTEKYGLDVQRQKIVEYCEKEKITIDKWYVDGGYSGSKLDRPEIQRLLADAEHGEISKVFVYKLDRLSRDTVDTLNLLNKTLPKYGVQIISMTEDIRTERPMDKIMVTLNAAMNQYEREIIYMRTRAGMKRRVEKGLWPGGGNVPFGYYYDRNDGIIHIKEDEAKIVKEAFGLYIDGYSCEKISKLLGFKGARIVMQILKRKSNIGLIEYKGNEYKGLHEPIIDEQTFYRAQECMKRRHTNSHVANDHILTGLCYCGRCGARMRYQKWGPDYHKIVCYSQYRNWNEYMIKDPNCDNEKVRADIIESEVENCFKRFSINVEDQEKNESKMGFIESSIQKCNSKIKKLYSLYAENDSGNLLEVIQEEEKRLKELKKELEGEIKKESKVNENRIEKIRKMADIWDDLSNQEKNKILKLCVDKVVIDGGDIEVYFKI